MLTTITFILNEENVELCEKIAAFISEHSKKIEMVKLENDSGGNSNKVMIVVSDNERLPSAVMIAKIIAAADPSTHLIIDDCARRIAILGLNQIENSHFLKIFADAQQVESLLKKNQKEYPNFAEIKKKPIPAKCKNGKKNKK